MKALKQLAFISLTSMCIACGEKEQPTNLITIDVNADYPKKEISLQDFMEVEYIPLETSDEFITQGAVMAIGEKHIIVKNWSNDGDIFIFDRKTGAGISKINRKGQGAEEYAYINGVILDEENNEMFVNSSAQKKILVYDLHGNFKRSLNLAVESEYMDFFNYDKEHLIGYDISLYRKEGQPREKDQAYHTILSKQDGSVTQHIFIPFETIRTPFIQKGDAIAATTVRPVIPNQQDWLLVETSSDTIYTYHANQLSPLFVKTSSVNPEKLVTVGVVTDQYYFLQTIEKEFDFSTGRGFATTNLVYDKQEAAFFKVSVTNRDNQTPQKVDMYTHPVNKGIATFQALAAHQLVNAYQKGKLTGKLKDIASTLQEESNPIIMIAKNK